MRIRCKLGGRLCIAGRVTRKQLFDVVLIAPKSFHATRLKVIVVFTIAFSRLYPVPFVTHGLLRIETTPEANWKIVRFTFYLQGQATFVQHSPGQTQLADVTAYLYPLRFVADR